MVDEYFAWQTGTWVAIQNQPIILLWARSNLGNGHLFQIGNFRPYFYIPEMELQKIESLPPIDKEKILEIEDKDYIAYNGEKVKKIICKFPFHVKELRSKFEETYEADILFHERYLIDKRIKYAFIIEDNKLIPYETEEIVEPRICFFDIEVISPPEIFPKPEEVEYPILTIQCLDTYKKDIKVFTLNFKDMGDERQVNCSSEKELLYRFWNYVKEREFDIISGWNSNRFDIPYLIRRSNKLGVMIPTKFPRKTAWTSKRGSDWISMIPGYQLIDFCEFTQEWHVPFGDLPSWDLKFVTKHFEVYKLGVRDGLDFSILEEYEDLGAKIKRYYEDGLHEDLFKYCIQDVLALYGLELKLEILRFYEYIRLFSGVPLDRSIKNSNVLESMLFHEGIKPSPTRVHRQKTPYKGAIVLQPEIGIHEYVGVYDFSALYPSIIMRDEVAFDIDKMLPKVTEKTLKRRLALKAKIKKGEATETEKSQEKALKWLVNCLTSDHYVYVLGNGYTPIKDVKIGDRIISIDPVTLKPKIGKVTNLIVMDAPPTLLHVYSPKLPVNFLTTSNHRWFVKKGAWFGFVTSYDIMRQPDLYRIPSPFMLVNEPVKEEVGRNYYVLYDFASLKEKVKRFKGRKVDTYLKINRVEEMLMLGGAFPIVTRGKTKDYIQSYIGEIPLRAKPVPNKEYDKVYCLTVDKYQNFYATRFIGVGEGKTGIVIPTGNSYYGALSYTNFRWYMKELSEHITSRGREMIMKVKNFVEKEFGYRVIYGDTDSIFIKFGKPINGEKLEKAINEFINDPYLKIEFEKMYRSIIFVRKKHDTTAAKKRYAGIIDGKNELEIKGLEVRRSDAANLTKDLVKTVLEMLLTFRKEEAVEYVRSLMKNFENLSIQDIAVPRGVSKFDPNRNDPWIEGIKNFEEAFKIRFNMESKPKLLYLKRPYRCICITDDIEKLPTGFIIDKNRMIDRVIVSVVEPIFEAAGIPIHTLYGQTTLERWF